MADDAWQSAWVEVVPDFTDFRKTANKQMTGILGDAGDEAGRSGSKKAGTSFVGGIGGWLPGIAAGIAALGIGRLIGDAISSGVDLAIESINLASDLNESKNAIKVAYGSAFADVEKLAKGSDVRLGLSEGDFNAIATQFSAFAQSIRSNDPSKFLDELTTRGADFASVFNIDVNEALSLFQSGLAGENEPLRKYGIDLSAASVNAFAYANGIGAAGAELTEAQKQQARYGLLLQQTDKVQGDFKNTSGELANSQRIFNASVQDTQAKFGTYLLPALTSFMQIANEQILPILSSLADQVGPVLADALVQVTPAIVSLIIALAPLIPPLIQLAVELLPPLVALFVAMAPVLIDVASNLSTAATNMNAFFALLAGDVTFDEFIDTLFAGTGSVTEFSQSIMQFAIDAGNYLRAFAADVSANIDGAVNFFVTLPGKILRAVGDLGNTLYSAGQDLIQGFLDGIDNMFGDIGSTMSGVMSFVQGFFPHSPAERGPFAGSGWSALKNSGAAVFDQFSSGFQSGVSLSPALSSSVSVSSLRPSLDGVNGGGGSQPIYVQNPWTGEYMQARFSDVAAGVVGKYDKANQQTQQREYGGLY